MTGRARFLEEFDGFLFDLDGVVYAGDGAVDGAPDSIRSLDEAGARVGFVTNNASRSEEAVARHLASLGVPVRQSQVFGSARTGVGLLGQKVESGARVFVVGSEFLAGLVREAGMTPLGLDEMEAGGTCDAVIQGFDPSIGWRHLAAASFALERGAAWVATNMDSTIPRAEGVAPGNGSLVRAVMGATGREPIVAGKPQPAIFQRAARELGMSAPLVVGDRLDTDIAGGRASGYATALVLTGIDTLETIEGARDEDRPDYVIDSLRDLVGDVKASSFTCERRLRGDDA